MNLHTGHVVHRVRGGVSHGVTRGGVLPGVTQVTGYVLFTGQVAT